MNNRRIPLTIFPLILLIVSCGGQSGDRPKLQVNASPQEIRVTHFEINEFQVEVVEGEQYQVRIGHISTNFDQYGFGTAAIGVLNEGGELIAYISPTDHDDVVLDFVAPYSGEVIIGVWPPSIVDDNYVGDFTVQIVNSSQ